MAKLIYKPFGIVLGLLAGLLGRKLFDRIWALIDDQEPPKPNTRQTTWPKAVGAAAVQAATFSATKAAVDRAGARGFEHLTGFWPGPERAEAK